MSDVPEERTAAASAVTADERDPAADEEGPGDIRAHLADVEDGCGCAEVWEHLSSGRGE